jgi:hypothetical protein
LPELVKRYENPQGISDPNQIWYPPGLFQEHTLVAPFETASLYEALFHTHHISGNFILGKLFLAQPPTKKEFYVSSMIHKALQILKIWIW